ncbi:MAG TPA: hypothetical protein VFK05_27995 [Polyangiaceae bacterium]|nr:hypothetical protein [Polyangiaceae bacterium]
MGSTACSAGATDDPALAARLRLDNAQWVVGALPSDAGGPEVAAINLTTTTIWPGLLGKPISGALGPEATAAAIALSTDTGYWIVRAGPPDISAPTLPTFHTAASFSWSLPSGAYTLEVRAVDAKQRFGAPRRQILTALEHAPSLAVEGTLVITLTWDSEADVDLHVVDPLGNEIYHGATNSVNAFGATDSSVNNGRLGHDSNADCAIDGLRQEDVTWAEAPPSGHYLVRVDTLSLCGRPNARWSVQASLNGTSLGVASGLALESDTRGPHDRGAGVLALEFDVP